MESIEYLVETPGEDIPHLNMRVFYKHRGIEKRFEGMTPADGVLLAERTEGVASVAHALAYCHAIEQMAGAEVPWPAALVRVLHAELERLAGHLDVAMRLSDAAGLAVATARFALHKETVLRLVSQMCGSRFGRGVVVPGGVAARPGWARLTCWPSWPGWSGRSVAMSRCSWAPSSFLDRLRRTGPLRPERAREHGALGPVGRASATTTTTAAPAPTTATPLLSLPERLPHDEGDAMDRLRVRWDEVPGRSACCGEAGRRTVGRGRSAAPASRAARGLRGARRPGRGLGRGPAGRGAVRPADRGRADHPLPPRSASFHNLVLFHEVFAGDILTDFPFIEASFGLSVAGVALMSPWALRGLRNGVVTTALARPGPTARTRSGLARPGHRPPSPPGRPGGRVRRRLDALCPTGAISSEPGGGSGWTRAGASCAGGASPPGPTCSAGQLDPVRPR